MWTKISVLASVIVLSAGVLAQPLTLLTPVSSRMPSGSEFRAVDSAGKNYAGILITRPARRFLRRGSVLLRFYDTVHVVNADPEGVISRGPQEAADSSGNHAADRQDCR